MTVLDSTDHLYDSFLTERGRKCQDERSCFVFPSPWIRRRQWHPTPVLLPRKSYGRRRLVGCSPWGRWGLVTTERLHFHFHFHALDKEMATHSSVLAWRIPGTGEPGGLPSMGSHRVRHDWSDLAAALDLSKGCSDIQQHHFLFVKTFPPNTLHWGKPLIMAINNYACIQKYSERKFQKASLFLK